MGPHEPYWRTNTSFSPPPTRWDLRNHSEGQSFGSQDSYQLYGSSTSSNSRESRSWLRGSYLPNHRHSVSDGVGLFITSPCDFSPAQQCTTPAIQEISVDDLGNSSRRVLRPLSFSPTIEEGSGSSHSESTDNDTIAKSQSTNRNLSTRSCFTSKSVHPVTFPPEFPDSEETLHSCDFDFTDVSEPTVNQSYVYKCGLCQRLLSQRSPWSSRRIVRSVDMPVTGVLSCRHVFHAECLDQITPKVRKNDPFCPVCAKSVTSVEGAAISAPSGNTMLVFNRNRIKKSISLEGNSRKTLTATPSSSGKKL